MDVSDILKRLHRSTHMHFMRSTTNESLCSILRRLRKDRRLKINKIFQNREGDETISEVVQRLNDLIAKRILHKKSKMAKDSRNAEKINHIEPAVLAIPSSSFDESDYMGDASAVSSLVVTDKDKKAPAEDIQR